MVSVALLYSFLSAVRRGVHHGLDLGEGRDRGVTSSRVAIRESREEKNHSLIWAGEGLAGAGGMRKLTRLGRRASRSVWSQQAVLRGGLSSGDAKVIRIGT